MPKDVDGSREAAHCAEALARAAAWPPGSGISPTPSAVGGDSVKP